EGPDAESEEGQRQEESQPCPGQVRVVDRQGGPGDEEETKEESQCREEPTQSRQRPAHQGRSGTWLREGHKWVSARRAARPAWCRGRACSRHINRPSG